MKSVMRHFVTDIVKCRMEVLDAKRLNILEDEIPFEETSGIKRCGSVGT